MTPMSALDLRMLSTSSSDCRKRSVVVKQSTGTCVASYFDDIINGMSEAVPEEMLKFMVRIFTKNVISYACRSIICNNGSVEGTYSEHRRGVAREYCVYSID